MRRADKDGTIREIVEPLLNQNRTALVGGDKITLEQWWDIVSHLDQLDIPVQVYDAEIGMQLVKTPSRGGLVWISPSPLREKAE